jgi:hypothetical protein
LNHLGKEHAVRDRKPERDVPIAPRVANSRDEGGVPDPEHPDQRTTTGTTPNEKWVGRVEGEDVGYAGGGLGVERRAEAASGD